MTVDLAHQTDEELARLQVHPNEWYVRTARRLLQERAAAGKDMAAAHRVLREVLSIHPDVAAQAPGDLGSPRLRRSG